MFKPSILICGTDIGVFKVHGLFQLNLDFKMKKKKESLFDYSLC